MRQIRYIKKLCIEGTPVELISEVWNLSRDENVTELSNPLDEELNVVEKSAKKILNELLNNESGIIIGSQVSEVFEDSPNFIPREFIIKLSNLDKNFL